MRKALRTVQNYVPGSRDRREMVSRVIRRFRHQPYGADFTAVQHLPPGQLLLDVGTNYGQSIDSMLLMQPQAAIIGYEPNGELAHKVAGLFRSDPRVAVHDYGLSDTAGTFSLYVPYYRSFPYPGLASLNEDGAATLLSRDELYFYRRDNVSVRPVTCQLETLDAQGLQPYFIKLDVQGAEYRVLQGGRETLARCSPILMIENPGGDPRIHPLLRALGYHEFQYDRGRFVPPRSQDANSFFLTQTRQQELSVRNSQLFMTQ